MAGEARGVRTCAELVEQRSGSAAGTVGGPELRFLLRRVELCGGIKFREEVDVSWRSSLDSTNGEGEVVWRILSQMVGIVCSGADGVSICSLRTRQTPAPFAPSSNPPASLEDDGLPRSNSDDPVASSQNLTRPSSRDQSAHCSTRTLAGPGLFPANRSRTRSRERIREREADHRTRQVGIDGTKPQCAVPDQQGAECISGCSFVRGAYGGRLNSSRR